MVIGTALQRGIFISSLLLNKEIQAPGPRLAPPFLIPRHSVDVRYSIWRTFSYSPILASNSAPRSSVSHDTQSGAPHAGLPLPYTRLQTALGIQSRATNLYAHGRKYRIGP